MFTCAQCQESFLVSRRLEIHARAQKHKSYICSKCPKSFTSRAAHWKHEQTHLKPASFPCEFCKKVLSRREHLRKHMRKYHSDIKTKPQIQSRETTTVMTDEASLASLDGAHADPEMLNTPVPARDCQVQPQSSDVPSTWPEAEIDFLNGFACCQKIFGSLHQLFDHYEETHANSPQRVGVNVTEATSRTYVETQDRSQTLSTPHSQQMPVLSVIENVPESVSPPCMSNASGVPDIYHHLSDKSGPRSETPDSGAIALPDGETYRFNHKTRCYERSFQGVIDRFTFHISGSYGFRFVEFDRQNDRQ